MTETTINATGQRLPADVIRILNGRRTHVTKLLSVLDAMMASPPDRSRLNEITQIKSQASRLLKSLDAVSKADAQKHSKEVRERLADLALQFDELMIRAAERRPSTPKPGNCEVKSRSSNASATSTAKLAKAEVNLRKVRREVGIERASRERQEVIARLRRDAELAEARFRFETHTARSLAAAESAVEMAKIETFREIAWNGSSCEVEDLALLLTSEGVESNLISNCGRDSEESDQGTLSPKSRQRSAVVMSNGIGQPSPTTSCDSRPDSGGGDDVIGKFPVSPSRDPIRSDSPTTANSKTDGRDMPKGAPACHYRGNCDDVDSNQTSLNHYGRYDTPGQHQTTPNGRYLAGDGDPRPQQPDGGQLSYSGQQQQQRGGWHTGLYNGWPTDAGTTSMQELLTNIQGLLKVAAENASLHEKHSELEIADLKLKLNQELQLREQTEKQLSHCRRDKDEAVQMLAKEKHENLLLHARVKSMRQILGFAARGNHDHDAADHQGQQTKPCVNMNANQDAVDRAELNDRAHSPLLQQASPGSTSSGTASGAGCDSPRQRRAASPYPHADDGGLPQINAAAVPPSFASGGKTAFNAILAARLAAAVNNVAQNGGADHSPTADSPLQDNSRAASPAMSNNNNNSCNNKGGKQQQQRIGADMSSPTPIQFQSERQVPEVDCERIPQQVSGAELSPLPDSMMYFKNAGILQSTASQ